MKPTIAQTAFIRAILLLIALLGHTGILSAQTVMPTPYQTAFDNSGHIINNSCVWVYVAGTTTPATTYTDQTLGTPNANPIRTDPAGRFTAFLTAGSSYKFVYESACTPPAHGTILRTADGILAMPGTSNPTTDISAANLRLTLTLGTPVTTADVTAATSVYIEPYRGNRIALYDGVTWNLRTVTATSVAVPATTSTLYDVFVYDSASVPTYETLAWTNDTTRATALTTQDGVLVKSGALTRRYLGSFRTTTVSGQTEDSLAKRYVWNYYNRVQRTVQRNDAAASWNYTTATWRQANAAAANQIDVVQGVSESPLWLQLQVTASSDTGGGAGVSINIGIGEDSTTAPVASAVNYINIVTGLGKYLSMATLGKVPAVGRHVYTWLEGSQALGTTTFYGLNNSVGGFTTASGLFGTWWS